MSIQKPVNAIYRAGYTDYDGLDTYRVLPSRNVTMDMMDPFIFLNHHGWQMYGPRNGGLPFGPHPHRGFETVTFILEGDLIHKDSSGAATAIRAGGVQWMTAGSGLIHAEISSEEFKAQGGPLEILQLWVNLPAKLKMTDPKYVGLQKEEIPVEKGNGVLAQIISGNWNGVQGAFSPLTDIHLATLHFTESGTYNLSVPANKNIFFYVAKGAVDVNGEIVLEHHLVHFANEGEEIGITAQSNAVVLLGHATPYNEPIMAHGPFVMNTREEVMQAFDDYHKGKFGDAEALL